MGWGDMAEAVGLSIGATRLAGVQLGGAAVTRRPVLTIQGTVVASFVERVGDPVGMVAADGSIYRGEFLVADALRELLYTVTDGHPPASPAVITYPTHWPRGMVDALRTALAEVPEWSRTRQPITLIADAAAAISALQSDPGVPARGVIALCDFGGTGTSITLMDASRGYAPVCPTVRHADFSGELIDQALLTHVVADLAPAGGVDATGTSALGPLHRLRGQCASAKERLSSATVTALTAELPGFRGDVRLTRTELEEQIRRPLAEFVCVLQDTLDRSGVRAADLAAVASIGGGARIPLVTTTLSERFRVPVVTTPRPELAAASGAALRAARGPADDKATVMVAASAFADADAQSSTFRALAWSEAHDVPRLAPLAEPMDDDPRPQLEFVAAETPVVPKSPPWYRRRSSLVGVAASVALLLATSAVLAFGSSTSPSSSTAPLPSTTAQAPGVAAPPAAGAPAQPGGQDQPMRTVYANPAPVTRYQQPAASPAPAQPAPAPNSEAPPPPPQETTTVATTTQAPTFTTTVTAEPSPEPTPTTQPPAPEPPTQTPSSTTQAPVTVTIPQIPSIPGVFDPPPSQ